MIEFTFENYWKVFANEDGTGIIVYNETDDEIPLEYLSDADQIQIKSRVEDESIHLKVMKENGGIHPADGEFGEAYVRGLNKDMF